MLLGIVLTASSSFQTIKPSHEEEPAYHHHNELPTRSGYQKLSQNNQDKQREAYGPQSEVISSLGVGNDTSQKRKAKSYRKRRYTNLIS